MAVDPRGQRFAAALTSIVLVVVLATGWWWLALVQTVVFAITAANPRLGPYGYVYRLVWSPSGEREPAEPVRFAQLVGFCFLAVATVGYAGGLTALGVVFASFGLLAAFLNAAFGLCLGCEAYLAIRRLSARNA